MINLYDIVRSSKNLNDKVYKGCKGTVLIIYPDSSFVYEVEFFDDNGETLDVLTLVSTEIELIDSYS